MSLRTPTETQLAFRWKGVIMQKAFAIAKEYMMADNEQGNPDSKTDPIAPAHISSQQFLRLCRVLHMAAAAIQPSSTPEAGSGFDIASKNETQIQFLDNDFVSQNVAGVLKVGIKVIGQFAFSVCVLDLEFNQLIPWSVANSRKRVIYACALRFENATFHYRWIVLTMVFNGCPPRCFAHLLDDITAVFLHNLLDVGYRIFRLADTFVFVVILGSGWGLPAALAVSSGTFPAFCWHAEPPDTFVKNIGYS
jgi:hypothetical protein